MAAPTPLVHFYVQSSRTFVGSILCCSPTAGITHATEYGNQVTCQACAAILRARARQYDEEHDNPWPE